MGETMDPIKVAEHFSTLNLKLMKWRLLPNLNLDVIKKQKCLLFGAGTLGCAIARSLLSWGILNIDFIDCGRVAFSNPVRQSLFTHADASQNKFKATAAAERLKEILPSVKSTGHVLQIPMPGHSVDDSSKDKTIESIQKLVDLIKKHDILFLLTDSRESRWLATMLGAFYGKVSDLKILSDNKK
jgi:ubiquitin-like modifier-activating enzyme ATG7